MLQPRICLAAELSTALRRWTVDGGRVGVAAVRRMQRLFHTSDIVWALFGWPKPDASFGHCALKSIKRQTVDAAQWRICGTSKCREMSGGKECCMNTEEMLEFGCLSGSVVIAASCNTVLFVFAIIIASAAAIYAKYQPINFSAFTFAQQLNATLLCCILYLQYFLLLCFCCYCSSCYSLSFLL